MMRKTCAVSVLALLLTSGCPLFGNFETSLFLQNELNEAVIISIFQGMEMFEPIIVDPLSNTSESDYFETELFVGGGRPLFGEYRVIIRYEADNDFIGECYPIVEDGDELRLYVIQGAAAFVQCETVARDGEIDSF